MAFQRVKKISIIFQNLSEKKNFLFRSVTTATNVAYLAEVRFRQSEYVIRLRANQVMNQHLVVLQKLGALETNLTTMTNELADAREELNSKRNLSAIATQRKETAYLNEREAWGNLINEQTESARLNYDNLLMLYYQAQERCDNIQREVTNVQEPVTILEHRLQRIQSELPGVREKNTVLAGLKTNLETTLNSLGKLAVAAKVSNISNGKVILGTCFLSIHYQNNIFSLWAI